VKIALTFDVEFPGSPSDGNRNLSNILSLLHQSNILAMFFVEGRWAAAYPDQLRAISKAGHTIGNHMFHHAQSVNLTTLGFFREYRNTRRILTSLTGSNSKMKFRLPYGSGSSSPRIKIAMKLLGVKHVNWQVDSFDWRDDQNTVVENLKRQLATSSEDVTILFHSWPNSTITGLEYLLHTYKNTDFYLSE
jgi:peptidoglycan/xylan/chitin deacetylase (PgdA/CDA1 family)